MSRPKRPPRVAVRLDRASAATAGLFAGILETARVRRWTLTDEPADADGLIADADAPAPAGPTVVVGPAGGVRPAVDRIADLATAHFHDRGFRGVVTLDATTVSGFDPAAPPRPAAVLAADDAIAARVVAAVLAAGRAVPGDVAVLGVGNDVLACELAGVPVSSVDVGWPRLGRAAAVRLGRLMRGQPVPAVEELPPLGVVGRASTDTLAIADADVAAAVRFIREHAAGPLRVGDVLRAVDLDRRTLERRFAAALGRSPAEVIRRSRVEQAAELLRTTDLPVGDIARACGFRLSQHLAAAFKRIRGQTPSDYRAVTPP